MGANPFNPALIVVDLQEDFCPPNGSLAVPDGRAIIPTVNALLSLPFALRIATKDWHPANHISFASNHADAQPYTSFFTIHNPSNEAESYETRLWPIHCVQNTPGAALVPELDTHKIDKVVEKGLDPRVEMYSAFYDPLKQPRVSDSGLAGVLRGSGVTHVYVVGLAADYCVKFTAIDAASEGFQTCIIEDGTRAVDEAGWEEGKKELEAEGVKIVKMDGEEVGRVVVNSHSVRGYGHTDS